MLIGNNTNTRSVNGLDPSDLQRITDFLQDAVNCWCKDNNKGKKFAARDLVGGGSNWTSTPLNILYTRQIAKGKTQEQAYKQAAIDVGTILKNVLANDSRTFYTKKDYVRQYMW